MSDAFTKSGVPGLLCVTSNRHCYAGNAKLFGRIVYTWHNEVGGRDNEWADHHCGTIGFAALHHVTPDKKSTNRAGWSWTFASLKLARIYGGFSVAWRWADRYSTRQRSKPEGRQRSAVYESAVPKADAQTVSQ